MGLSRSKVLSVLVLGFIGCVITTIWLTTNDSTAVSLPMTSILLYCTCALAYAGITASPTLGDQSPTTQLLLYLRNGPKTKKQLFLYLVKHDVITKRINDLTDSKCITKSGSMIRLTQRGKQLAGALIIYRRVLKLTEGG